ncbi:MAG TPA: DNA primase small subunit domain-containing protein, partial [Candidatus Poseidoniaceae archaeon]|nr:DNA primase small subunit domain-containing protein [Candidatus Poseidoniaceae archaeon]
MASSDWARYALKFGDYYRNAELWTPPRLRMREWMLSPFGTNKPLRHKSFSSVSNLREFLVNRTPASVFYSTAYWNDPNELKMSDKGWKGADLIFDLDGDHLPHINPYNFPEMLETIREYAWNLWYDFLEPDFGFDEKYLQVTFSGHRGFHLHYRDPNIFHLDSSARRELVNHIRGNSVDVDKSRNTEGWINANGWPNKVVEGSKNLIEKIDFINNNEGSVEAKILTNSLLESMGEKYMTKNKKPKAPFKNMIEKFKGKGVKEQIMTGKFTRLGEKNKQVFEELIKADQSIILSKSGETDDPVTVDVRRVIRYPTSLHGKSGLKVTEFPLHRLDPDNNNKFDPLTEAVVFG